jgi:hypothetical protein
MAPKKSKSSGKYPPKGKKKAEEILETENDFLKAADAMEGSMSKWRVGDPTKAVRFFSRALEIYNQGVSKFPNDVDLLYNKQVLARFYG